VIRTLTIAGTISGLIKLNYIKDNQIIKKGGIFMSIVDRFKVVTIVVSINVLVCTNAIFGANDSGWEFKIGPTFRVGMEAEVSGSSKTRVSGIQAADEVKRVPALSGIPNVPDVGPNPDDITQEADRSFDNGFVFTDAVYSPYTYNYLYANSDQYDPGAGTLTFSRTTEESESQQAGSGTILERTVVNDYSSQFNDSASIDGWGLRAEASYNLAEWKEMDVKLVFGARSFWDIGTNFSDTTFSQIVNEKSTGFTDVYSCKDAINDTYVYDASGQYLPDAGNMPDPVSEDPIPNRPDSTTRTTSRDGVVSRSLVGGSTRAWKAENRIDMDVDSKLYQLAIGGSLSSKLFDGCRITLQPSLLLNMLDADLDRREQFYIAEGAGEGTVIQSWRDQKSETKYLFGVGMELGLVFNLTDNIFLAVNGGYELVEKAKMEIGPNSVELDVSAFTASGMCGITF
jgi:hypothetical protein